MLKNSKKIAISNHFLISILFVVLIFASVGVSMDDVCASDLNQSVSGIESELNIEDKLGNSQDDVINTNLEVEERLNVAQDEEILGSTFSLLEGGKFSDIKDAVSSAKNGDVIKLAGKFKAEKGYDQINIDKRLTIMSDSSATLDGKNLTHIFVVSDGGAKTTFKNLKIINGYRSSTAAGIYVNTHDVTISNCEFRNNDGHHGSAICTPNDNFTAKNLLVENCKFIKNHAVTHAGAIVALADNSRIFNCTFDSNNAYDPTGIRTALGGAIQIGLDNYRSRGYVYDCVFKNNWVKPTAEAAHGGAGCVRDGVEYKNCIFINNSASQGGALTMHASGLIKNCTFINNSATLYGGAVSTGFAEMSMDLGIQDCVFEGNVAPVGGAVQLKGMNIGINNCKFDNNKASEMGGAVNINAETVNVYGSSFNNNIANIDGGAIFINGKNTQVSESSFISNDAIPDADKLDDGLGGAIYINSTKASIKNNKFLYNTARNGSAIYYDKSGLNLNLTNNVLFENQAWVYALPIYAHDIYYGQVENIGSIIHGGNNIGKYNDLSVSNAIYNAASNANIIIDGEKPVLGATTNGHLYQDDCEYNMNVLMTVIHEDGTVVYNKTLNSDCFGEVKDSLKNLKVGKYYVYAKHYEDTYYKGITNTTTFKVTAQVDDKIRKSVSSQNIDYKDIVIWTLNVTNNGPSNATGLVIKDVLPKGLIYIEDNTNGAFDPVTGTLKLDFLKVGDVYIVNIKTMVNKTGEIINKANVTAREYDYNLTNNHDDSKIIVNPACDLAIKKTCNVSRVNLTSSVEWTLTVTNNGPDVATGVVVRDVLPKSLIWVSDNGLGKFNHNSGVWTIGTLNKGASATLKIVTRVNQTGNIKNEASVSGNQNDYDESNNYDSDTVKVDSAADLGIVKLVSNSVANYNDIVKWTLTVTNYGPDAATGVKIYDTLPKGFIYLNSTKTYSNGVINIGNLAKGTSVSVDIYTKVNITGNFVNIANVKGNEHDYNLANNKADASILIKPATDLAIIKLVNNSSPNFADNVQWTLAVTNNGPDVATGVVVRDVLPKSLIWISDNGLGKFNHNSGVWTVGTLNKGASATLKIVTKVNQSGTIKNSVSVSGNEFDYDESNNNDSKIINVDPAADLGIVKLVSSSFVNYTDVVKWTLTVTNNGPDAATGVKIYDTLPKGFIYLNSTKSYSNGVINIGNLAKGASVSVDIYAKVNITGSFVNVASVKGNQYDYNPKNNQANASVLVKPASDLYVKKVVNNSKPNYNELITWTLTVTNNGPDVATGVVVRDVLPKELVWTGDNGLGKYNHNTGVWNVGSINNAQTKILTITTLVNATGNFTNIVSVSGNEFDYNKSNNKDNETITVANASDLSVVKLTNSSTVNYLQLVKWTIVAKNNGPNKATGVYVDEILPDGLKVINYTATKGFYDNYMWRFCCMETGEIQTLELICQVTKTGKLTNIVRINGNEYDPDKSNNEDTESILVPISSDLAVVKTVDDSYPNYGDIVNWNITVYNNGPDDAYDVFVFDLMPEGLELLEYSATVGNYHDGTWIINSLNNGRSETLILRCLVKTLDDIENIVNVVPSEYDWNESNNNDSEVISVNPIADLEVIKLVDNNNPNYLDFVKWSLIVTNHGPNDATGVTVSDVIPNGLEIIDLVGDGVYENSLWYVGDLAVDEYKQLDIICKVHSTGEFTNVAMIWADQDDPDLENNEDENYIVVPPASDISITKSVSKYQYFVGDLVKYSIKVTNNGPNKAENVEISEIMDNNLLLKSFHASYGDFDEKSGVWSLDELDVGQSAFLKIDAIAQKPGTAENKVVAKSDNYDPDLSNNDDTVTINISKKDKPHNGFDKGYKKHSNDELRKYSESILEKHVAGNPFMVLVLLFVFTMGAVYGKNILKKR